MNAYVKRDECPRCGIRGHVKSKCNKPAWWKRNDKPIPAVIPAQIKGNK